MGHLFPSPLGRCGRRRPGPRAYRGGLFQDAFELVAVGGARPPGAAKHAAGHQAERTALPVGALPGQVLPHPDADPFAIYCIAAGLGSVIYLALVK